MHPSAHLGSSKRMGKAPSSYGHLGIVYQGPSSIAQEYLLVSGLEWPFGVWLMCPHPSCLLSNYCMPHPGWKVKVRPGPPSLLTRYTAQPREGAITYCDMLSSMMKPLWLLLASS